MGIRFGRKIRLGKYIQLHISRSGVGVGIGVPGARVSMGPRGGYLTTGIPGSGLSYRKKIAAAPKLFSSKKGKKPTPQSSDAALQLNAEPLRVPVLGTRHEKNFVKGLNAIQAGRKKEARRHLQAAIPLEPSAAILMAFILMEQEDGEREQAIKLLEDVIQSDQVFPTALALKYLPDAQLRLTITPHVRATVPLDALGATLGLVELYQTQGRIEEAIGLLEEVEELADEPVVTLSLCELYANEGLWDGIIDCASGITSEDDVTLETMVMYGRAMQQNELHTAAIKVFTDALRRKKGRNPLLLNEAMYWRAIAYEVSGKRSRAKQEFEKVFANDPDFRDVFERVKSSKQS